ncbi:MAG: (2Fe-2S)-binding protein [Deltaproteobacteria bacterium]|nr:(2Fe-2S)-binding protein [Deltaproteobacteria bacterium]
MKEEIRFTLNGVPRTATVDGDRMLLWVLRTDLGLTGTKYGCGEGLCGACTVLINGEAVRSCGTAASEVQGKRVTTIEGLAAGEELHPVQKAFMAHDALQCGYCTPGMILQATALLGRNPEPSAAEIADALEENLCRCGAHNRIVRAVLAAASQMKGGS